MPYNYSSQEYRDILFIYGFCDGNALAARREYARRYPLRHLPGRTVFESTYRRLGDGTLFRNETGRQAVGRLDDRVLNAVRRNPTISTRNLANNLGLSQSTVWRVLHEDGQHPYHYTTVQDLILPIDPQQRLGYCRQMLEMYEADPNFLSRILSTDESQFTRNGIVNLHNEHVWDHQNPHAKKTKSYQHRFSVNVWAGIIGNTLIGPFILPDRLNSQSYLQFLIDKEDDILEETPLAQRIAGIIFQHDGCPAHYGLQVRDWLNLKFPGGWIGRGGPIPWPARSPDLTPLDFYLWGFMKSYVYQVDIRTREQLIERIMEAGDVVRQNLQQFNMVRAIRKRLQKCVEQNGGHFEHLL